MTLPSGKTGDTSDRARRLLRTLMSEQGSDVNRVARALNEPPEAVATRIHGSDPVSLEWVERVLTILGVPPGEFFRRLYSDEDLGDGSSHDSLAGQEEILSRDEVEGLVAEARSLIRGATRMIEARHQAEEESGGEPPRAD